MLNKHVIHLGSAADLSIIPPGLQSFRLALPLFTALAALVSIRINGIPFWYCYQKNTCQNIQFLTS